MGRRIILGLGLIILMAGSAAVATFTTAELILGDYTTPKLRAWDFQDLSGTPSLFISKTVSGNDVNSVSLYQLVPPDEAGPASPLGSAIRLEGEKIVWMDQ